MSSSNGAHDNHWTYYLSTDFFNKYGDPRVSVYPLLRTPWPVISACLSYLVFVKILGPKWMQDKKPYELKSFIRGYNLLMVLWNGLGILFWIKLLNWGFDAWGCRPIDPKDTSSKALSLIAAGHMFLISRLVEFVDTICFVLRKKTRQISGFHVFHHFSVPIAVWFFVKFVPGGNSAIFPILNTIIHTIMYSYYFLATYPPLHPYLTWKKYLTQMQIVQFIIMIIHSAQPLFLADCKFPRTFLYVNICFSFIFIYLFAKFYIENYGKKTVRVARNLSRRFSQQVQLGVRRISVSFNPNNNNNNNNSTNQTQALHLLELQQLQAKHQQSPNITANDSNEYHESNNTIQITRRHIKQQTTSTNAN